MHTHSTISVIQQKYDPIAKSILSLLPSLDNPVYYNKTATLLKMIGIQPKQAV